MKCRLETRRDYRKKYWSNVVKLLSNQKEIRLSRRHGLPKLEGAEEKLNEMPAGDEKGLSKEILEQRRKIAEQSKRDKAEQKARLAKNGRSRRKN